MKRALPAVWLCLAGGCLVPVPDSPDAGPPQDSGLPNTLPDGGPTTPGTICTRDGTVVLSCSEGQLCPGPIHGHDTTCCLRAALSCAKDDDCCSGTCTDGGCGLAGPHRACGNSVDCASDNCVNGGCVPFPIGAACQFTLQCDYELDCFGGICSCLPPGNDAGADESSYCCGGWLLGEGCQCGSTTDRCMSTADCCPGHTCTNHRCS